MPQQQAEYMTCTPLRINAKFLLHRGRRPYMSLSKDAPRVYRRAAYVDRQSSSPAKAATIHPIDDARR